MYNVIKWFPGLLFLLIQMKEKCISARSCMIGNNDEGRLVANCSFGLIFSQEGNNEDLKNPEFPADLDKNIEILDASGFPASSLPSLYEYSRITELHLRKIYGLLPEGFFQSVPHLKVLDISGASFEGWPGWVPKLAPSIVTLRANSLQSLKPDISDLDKLEILFFSNNNLKEFPAISDLAPITRMDLSENQNMSVTLVDIAKFCHLKHLNLNRTNIKDEVTCCEIETWLVNHNIPFRLSCGRNIFFEDIDSGVYYEYDSKSADQEVDFESCSRPLTNQAAIGKYDECLNRSRISLFMTMLMVWFATAVVVFAVCMMYSGYRMNTSRPIPIVPYAGTVDPKLAKAGVKSTPQPSPLTQNSP